MMNIWNTLIRTVKLAEFDPLYNWIGLLYNQIFWKLCISLFITKHFGFVIFLLWDQFIFCGWQLHFIRIELEWKHFFFSFSFYIHRLYLNWLAVRVRLKTRIMDKKIKDISKLSKNDYGRLERKKESKR